MYYEYRISDANNIMFGYYSNNLTNRFDAFVKLIKTNYTLTDIGYVSDNNSDCTAIFICIFVII